MGIVSITNVQGRSGGWNDKGRRYKQTLRVLTDSKTVGPKAIIQGLPVRLGDTYVFPLALTATETDEGVFLTGIDVSENTSAQDGKEWEVTLDYGPLDPTQEGQKDADGKLDPMSIPPQVRWGSAKFSVAVTHDTENGHPLLNTVGDPFDPGLERDESRMTLTVVRNEETFNPDWVSVYKDTVNSDSFLGFEPNSVKCADIIGEQTSSPDYGWYWIVTYEFEFRPYVTDEENGDLLIPGWNAKILNAGMRENKSASDGIKHVSIDGAPVSSPVPLTEEGTWDHDADPYYLEFSIYPKREFSFFNMPEDLLTKTGKTVTDA